MPRMPAVRPRPLSELGVSAMTHSNLNGEFARIVSTSEVVAAP